MGHVASVELTTLLKTLLTRICSRLGLKLSVRVGCCVLLFVVAMGRGYGAARAYRGVNEGVAVEYSL